VTNGDLLSYDSSDSTWRNTKILKGSYTITGNTYFGITSGITLDQANVRIGINTSNPQHTIEAFGTKSKITYENGSGGAFQISGDTNLPRFGVIGAPSVTRPSFNILMGVRTYDDVTFPGYGKVGDTFIYASNEANGLNIINRQTSGSTLEDYIRFYAGQDANGTTPDIHIQGTGSTRGYVGFGITNPTEMVDISGNAKVRGQIISPIISATTVSATTVVLSGSNLSSSWTSYTPVWTASGTNPVINNGTIEGWYKVIGKTCFVRGNIAMGSTTTFGTGEWYVSMPVTAVHADAILMTVTLLDNGSAWYNATMAGARSGFNNKAPMQYVNYLNGTASDVNPTQPFTWTNGDRFIWNGSYEIQ